MANDEPFYRGQPVAFHRCPEYDRRSSYGGRFSNYGGSSSYGTPLEMFTGAFDGIATSKSREYDVFINCWMLDFIRARFIPELCYILQRRGFRPFLYTANTFKMFSGYEQIEKASKGPFVHVAIFSKGYAESCDCLDELCEILKSDQQIIPVFYDVKSIDLQRIEDGPYKEAFINHQKHGKTEKIPIWKEALRRVVDYKGFGMDEVNG